MIHLARVAVAGAILCTMWLNGSYAASKAVHDIDRVALVAIALSIDLAKCSFVSIAALLRANGRPWPALLAVVLWVPCLAYSTFAGYSMITTNRTTAGADTQGIAERRDRAQRIYEEANREVVLANSSPLWTASAACTAPRPTHRAFCDSVAKAKASRDAASTILSQLTPTIANPELAALTRTSGIDASTLALAAALLPALLLELLASIGSYVVSARMAPKSPSTPLRQRFQSALGWVRQKRKTRPAGTAIGLAQAPAPRQTKGSDAAQQPPTLAWQWPAP